LCVCVCVFSSFLSFSLSLSLSMYLCFNSVDGTQCRLGTTPVAYAQTTHSGCESNEFGISSDFWQRFEEHRSTQCGAIIRQQRSRHLSFICNPFVPAGVREFDYESEWDPHRTCVIRCSAFVCFVVLARTLFGLTQCGVRSFCLFVCLLVRWSASSSVFRCGWSFRRSLCMPIHLSASLFAACVLRCDPRFLSVVHDL
jgi:hypothetical protein